MNARIVLGSLLVMLVAASCRQIANIEDGVRPAGEVVTCGGFSSSSPECADCMVTSCCAEVADAGVASCRAERCSAPCKVRCGGYTYPNEACAACGDERCCAAAEVCMRDPACASLVECERSCAERDTTCLHACELEWPRGVRAARAFGTCVRTSCGKSCIGARWRCLERPPAAPPPSVAAAARLSYRFIDYETNAALPGLSVRVCNKVNTNDCVAPAVAEGATGATGADGTVDLRVPLGASEVYTQVEGAGYGPILVFLPRIAGDVVAGTIPLASHTAFVRLAAPIALPDERRGTIIASVRDCTGTRAGGVALDLTPSDGATRFYLTGRLPSVSAVATDEDGFGAGGFVNVEANKLLDIRASVVDNALAFPIVRAFARPGAGYTHVEIYATPP